MSGGDEYGLEIGEKTITLIMMPNKHHTQNRVDWVNNKPDKMDRPRRQKEENNVVQTTIGQSAVAGLRVTKLTPSGHEPLEPVLAATKPGSETLAHPGLLSNMKNYRTVNVLHCY